MRRIQLSLLVGTALVLSACASDSPTSAADDAATPAAMAAASAANQSAVSANLPDRVRTDADRERDAVRHTSETLTFAGVRPGQKVVDMVIGGGFFTRAFSEAVGPGGHVTAWQPAEFLGFSADYRTAADAAAQIGNVDVIRSPIGAPDFPAGVDLIFTAQNYHDLHLTPFATDTAARVNAAAFAALKPGGYYVVIDHHAAAGTGLTTANTLHRIDKATVKAEVEAAGFVLDGESTILANTTDPLTANVFTPAIRGQTSQFMLRFKKPA